jgi:hypothetical protein
MAERRIRTEAYVAGVDWSWLPNPEIVPAKLVQQIEQKRSPGAPTKVTNCALAPVTSAVTPSPMVMVESEAAPLTLAPPAELAGAETVNLVQAADQLTRL